jgi:hypothetical protein
MGGTYFLDGKNAFSDGSGGSSTERTVYGHVGYSTGVHIRSGGALSI